MSYSSRISSTLQQNDYRLNFHCHYLKKNAEIHLLLLSMNFQMNTLCYSTFKAHVQRDGYHRGCHHGRVRHGVFNAGQEHPSDLWCYVRHVFTCDVLLFKGGALLGNINALFMPFPTDPFEQYKSQCQVLLEELNLQALLQKELERLERWVWLNC